MKINFIEKYQDLEVLVLAELGLHTKAISRKVGLSPSQVQGRIKKGGRLGARRGYREAASIGWKRVEHFVVPVHRDKIAVAVGARVKRVAAAARKLVG